MYVLKLNSYMQNIFVLLYNFFGLWLCNTRNILKVFFMSIVFVILPGFPAY